MIRRALLMLVAGFALVGAAPARDWRHTVGTATGGGFTVGNPAARVKLVEYLSFTCPHCGHFAAQSAAVLHDAMVRGGSVAVETRSAARDPYDLAAWMVARCGGPRRFHGLSAAIFAAQGSWTAKGSAWALANRATIEPLSRRAQLRMIADRSGLSAIGARAGLTPAALDACFADDARLTAILVMTEAAFARIPGTPAFEINGALVDGSDWASLEPKLRAAGAR